MSHKLLIILSLVIFSMLFIINYNYAANGQKYKEVEDSVEKTEKDHEAFVKSIVGKKFWVSDKSNIAFYNSLDIEERKQFRVEEKTFFEVTEYIPSPYLSPTIYSGNFKVVFKDGKVGFLNENYLKPSLHLSDEGIFTKDPDIYKEKEEIKSVKVKRKAKKVVPERKKKEGVTIGMTKNQVLNSSWGKPRKVNTTILKSLIHEQWVYDGGYLYFENGVLTAIQVSN